MIYVSLPDDRERQASFYLAMEEWVAHNVEGDAFFMWVIAPSVVFGRNQLIDTEVNLAYCREHGIAMCRRKSGGGCIYADRGNVMMSYITADDGVGFTFNRYTSLVVLALQQLGIDARATGRNDIVIGDRKVSGTAFYRTAGRSIVHGTMLYDTCMENMVGAITPSDMKLRSKGVESVRQRVALLKDHLDISFEAFRAHVRTTLCNETISLSAANVSEIEALEREYLTDEFVYGNNPRCTTVRQGRIEGVGDMEIRLELKNNVIRRMTLLGDFFVVGDIDSEIIRPLTGCALQRATLTEALPDDLGSVVMNLRRADLIELLVGEAGTIPAGDADEDDR